MKEALQNRLKDIMIEATKEALLSVKNGQSNEYIRIEKEVIEGKKTPIYHIINNHHEEELGIIKWNGAWRQYCFFPREDTTWNNECISTILAFLIALKVKKGSDIK